jgi:ubiquitin conjugation factor E4 B
MMLPGKHTHTEHHIIDQFMEHYLATDHLPRALMRTYISCETMGGSNEFFDKFSVRYHLSTILIQLWDHPTHRSSIITESRYTETSVPRKLSHVYTHALRWPL